MILQPGNVFAGYRIDRLRGSGAMGVVYQAHDLTLDRAVAIKVMNMPVATPEDADRFRVEARIIARLSHPNILQVFAGGIEHGMPYLVTSLASGGTLADWLGHGPIRVDNVAHLLRPIAEALDYIHDEGVVHRDVKPQNILLEARGRPLLADFGVAKLLSGSSTLTGSGEMLGTPAYMAPEYVHGAAVTPATDRYALAVVVYELLVGQQPYHGQTGIQQLLAHANGPLPQPRQANPAISEALEEILLQGLARDPNRRFAKAVFLIDAIDAATGRSSSSGADHPTSVASPMPGAPDGITVHISADGGGDYPNLEEAVRVISPGSTIVLNAGEHLLHQPLTVGCDLTLVGAGRDKTTLSCSGEGHVLRFEGPGRFAARDLAFEHLGAAAADTVVVMDGTVLLERCRFVGSIASDSESQGGAGLRLCGSTSGTVRDCEASNNALEGIRVIDSSSPTLEANTCKRNQVAGIAYFGNAAGVALRNTCNENAAFGIIVGEEARPALEANICRQNTLSGIAYFDNSAGTARQNTCGENTGCGISVGGEAQPTLEGNICQRNQDCGIAFRDSAVGSARRNTCSQNAGWGIHVDEQAQLTLEGNTCERNQQTGIAYFGHATGTARQNICNQNAAFGIAYFDSADGSAYQNTCNENAQGIVVGSHAQPMLEANTCERNKNCGITFGDHSAATARQNICGENLKHGIGVQGQAQPTLEANTCRQNKIHGIAYFNGAAGTARGNTCNENTSNGIYMDGQAKPTLEANTCWRNKGSGIAFCEDAAGTARKNTCSENAYFGIHVVGQAKPALEANTCRQNSEGIVYSDHTAGIARQNLCSENEEDGIVVAKRAQPTLEANTCQHNNGNGIAFFDNAAGTASRNTCAGNALYGIYVDNHARPRLEANSGSSNVKQRRRW